MQKFWIALKKGALNLTKTFWLSRTILGIRTEKGQLFPKWRFWLRCSRTHRFGHQIRSKHRWVGKRPLWAGWKNLPRTGNFSFWPILNIFFSFKINREALRSINLTRCFSVFSFRYLRYGLLRCHEAPRILHHPAPPHEVQDWKTTSVEFHRLHEMVPTKIRRNHSARKIILLHLN